MIYCTRCGHQLNDTDNFCPACGFRQSKPGFTPNVPSTQYIPYPPQTNYQPAPPLPFNATPANYRPVPPPPYAPAPRPMPAAVRRRPKRPSAIGYFIWSLCLIFVLNPIGSLLGILSSVFSCKANASESADDFIRHRRLAKRLCITATCVDTVTIAFMISYAATFLSKYGTGNLFRLYW